MSPRRNDNEHINYVWTVEDAHRYLAIGINLIIGLSIIILVLMIIKLIWIKWRTNKCRVRNPELILKLFIKSTENDKRFIDIPLMNFETDLNCLTINNRPILIAINDCWGFGKIALKWSETLKYSDAGNRLI